MIKIAYRNIFRNKRRTFFTILSIIIGTTGIVFSMSYIEGLSSLIEKEAIKQTGHIRITQNSYDVKARNFDTSSNLPYEEIEKILVSDKNIKENIALIKFAGYLFLDDKDIKVLGEGIKNTENIEKYLIYGKLFDTYGKNEIVIGKKIFEKLNIKLGETITLVVNTQYFSTFALNYKVVGVINEESINKTVFLSLKDAQYLLDMEGRVSELHIYLERLDTLISSKNKLIKELSSYNVDIKSYEEIGFASAIKMYGGIKFIFVFIIGLLSSVAIFNTMVMSVFERRKEIGLLKAMGMEEKAIKILICLEGVFIGFIGSVIGVLLGSALSSYFQIKGIYVGGALDSLSDNNSFGDTIYTKLTFLSVIIAFFTGIIVSSIASYFPARKEVRREIIENINIKKM